MTAQTGISSVPIGSLTRRVKTWNPAREGGGKTIQYIDLGSIDNEAKQVVGHQSVPALDAPSRARQLVVAGDILVSTVRPNLNGVARVPKSLDGATVSTGFCVLRPDEHLDPGYLFQWVRSPGFVKEMVRRATGQSYPAVSDRIIFESELPLPPLDKQRRIAAILEQADALRHKRREAVNRIRASYSALFFEMFEDRILDRIKVGEHLEFLTSGSRGWASYYRESGSIFLRIQNVRDDELDLTDLAFVNAPNTAEAKRTRVEAGDVLLSITADLGRTAVVPDNLAGSFINQHLAILRTRSIHPRYLSAALSSPSGKRAILRRNREAVKAGLNFDDIRSLEVPKVAMSQQVAFATRAAQIDVLAEAAAQHSRQLDALFVALQHRAFQGEL